MTEKPEGQAIETGVWRDFMDDDETLLWQGQPSSRVFIEATFKNIFLTLFGVMWTSIAGFIFWELWNEEGIPALVILPFIGVGLFLISGRHFWDAYKRSKTRYALTNRRALVATSYLQRSVKSFPIQKGAVIEVRPGPETTVVFALEQRSDARGRHYEISQGFDLIEDGVEVAALIRKIQRGL